MENLRKRCNVELVTDETRLNKSTSKPPFVGQKIIDENFNGSQHEKGKDKPSYVVCVF